MAELKYLPALLASANLRAYYRFEDALDETANNYDLTNVGTTAFVAAKYNNGANYTLGNTTKLFYIDSTLGLNTSVASGLFAFSCWIKRYNSALKQCLSAIVINGQREIRIFLETNQYLNVRIFGSSGETIADNTTQLSSTSDYYHVGYQINKQALDIIVNGVVVKSGTFTNTTTTGGANIITFGSQSDKINDFAEVIMDDACYFDRTLTTAEWLSLYNEQPATTNYLKYHNPRRQSHF